MKINTQINNDITSTVSLEAMPLADDFVPGPMDVICARGKTAFNHPGNRRYRLIIKKNVQQYSSAKSKLEKSVIVSAIVESIREMSPSGTGFVQFKGGKWYEIDQLMAREKVGSSFRDLLHTKYRSSNKAKKRRREENVSNDTSKSGTKGMIKSKCLSFQQQEMALHLVSTEKLEPYTYAEVFGPDYISSEENAALKAFDALNSENFDQEPIPLDEAEFHEAKIQPFHIAESANHSKSRSSESISYLQELVNATNSTWKDDDENHFVSYWGY